MIWNWLINLEWRKFDREPTGNYYRLLAIGDWWWHWNWHSNVHILFHLWNNKDDVDCIAMGKKRELTHLNERSFKQLPINSIRMLKSNRFTMVCMQISCFSYTFSCTFSRQPSILTTIIIIIIQYVYLRLKWWWVLGAGWMRVFFSHSHFFLPFAHIFSSFFFYYFV